MYSLLPCSIPLCIDTTFSLSVHLLKSIYFLRPWSTNFLQVIPLQCLCLLRNYPYAYYNLDVECLFFRAHGLKICFSGGPVGQCCGHVGGGA